MIDPMHPFQQYNDLVNRRQFMRRSAMGLGAWLSRFVQDAESGFTFSQILLGVIGGFSAPILFLAAPFFGPFIRDLEPIHLWGLAFQIIVVVTLGFAFWLWLLSIYPAASVAAFSFLSPVFGVLFGWALLDEKVGVPIIIAQKV